VSAHVLFFQPGDVDPNWSRSDVWTAAASIPGVEVGLDADRRESIQFAASTSGHVVLYDGAGNLRFSGGITSSRGHVGDSEGSRQIAAVLKAVTVTDLATSVFGCPLHASHASSQEPGR
jgi:hypothetical protein